MILSFRKMFGLSVVALLIGTTVTWSLGRITFQARTVSKQAEKAVWPVKLTMSLDEVTFALGEEINVTLKLTNIGNETVILVFPSPMKVDFGVCDESLQVIYTYSSSHGTLGYSDSVTLDPGETLSRTLTWDQQGAPGTYFIFGRTGPGYIIVEPYGQEIDCIETDKIEIAIH